MERLHAGTLQACTRAYGPRLALRVGRAISAAALLETQSTVAQSVCQSLVFYHAHFDFHSMRLISATSLL